MEKVIKIQHIGIESYKVKGVHVARGDLVKRGDLLLTIESSKVVIEVRSDVSGVATAVLVHVGDRVKSGNAVVSVQHDFHSVAKLGMPECNVIPLRQGDIYGSARAMS